jgi:hypothetical protein
MGSLVTNHTRLFIFPGKCLDRKIPKEIKDHPETLGKKLTDGEREAADKEISLEELKETL